MDEYCQVEFSAISNEQKEILIAELSAAGFEGFEETASSLKAFIPAAKYHEPVLAKVAAQYNIPFSKTIIGQTNWNQVWESNFERVVVDDFVSVRADFHEPLPHAKHEIVITPKMSFGTGHHATTFMMIRQMREIDFAGKSVLDFGTGTGILAILAEKLGAKKITAIDNDDWSIANAGENIRRNDCSLIDLRKSETPAINSSVDIILANINKNVILDNFSTLVEGLSAQGFLLISGLLKEDEDDVFRKSNAYSLQLIQTVVRDNWLCLKFSR
jgi:ribosomal protein L11 methyltransferase